MSEARDLDIFTEALRLIESERAEYLRVACGGDEDMLARVEKLLGAFEKAGDFLSQPAAGAPSPTGEPGPPPEQPGSRVGRYKLLQQIGEGGCGVVFIAEQEEPVRRQVALKVIKPGMDTKNVIARFEAERQALALMDHPNISHVFDAGTTFSGRPYFVMELVRGVKITDYCDQKSLSTAERLNLFVQVCGAVQHAHQKGIIHRDLKPSNILIATSENGKPAPKVIDFGIAKATTGLRLTDKTLFTAFEMLIGTPAYMSPEQAELASVDVDTRSDIYSLGVLLYEMLTSTTPFDTAEALKRGLDELRRVIRDQVPVRPSTRLSTMLEADLTSVSQHRHADPPKLIREVRGDLDWIVMRALEKDRNRRYQTANGLAEDVRRFLANEVISARPPSRSYRLHKLIERNKIVFGALTALIAILAVALAAVFCALTRERAQASRSEEVSLFLREMLNGVSPEVAQTHDTTILRIILDKTASRLDTALTNQPVVQADLRQQLGITYSALAQHHEAESMFRQAVKIRTGLFGEESEAASDSMNDLGEVLSLEWKAPEGEVLIRRALAIRQKLLGSNDLKIAESYYYLSADLFNQRRWEESESAARASIKIYTNHYAVNDPRLGDSFAALGGALFEEGKYREAEEVIRTAVANLLPEAPNNPAVAVAQQRLAVVLNQEGQLTEAEALFRQSLEADKIYGPDHPVYITTLRHLTRLLVDEGRYPDAEGFLRQLLPLQQKHSGETSPEAMQSIQDLWTVFTRQGKLDEAHALLAAELPPGREIKSEQFGLVRLRRDFLARSGRWREAAVDAAFLVKQSPGNSDSYHGLAPLLAALKDMDGYKQLCGDIVQRFAGTTNFYDADRMAKDCLILPASGANLEVVGALADITIAQGARNPAYPLFECCKALAEYRQGHFMEATNWAESAVKNAFPYAKAEGYAILAMARLRSGQTNDAQAALSECGRVIEGLPKLSSGDLGQDWRDWIIAHALQTEASALCNPANQ